MKQLRSIRAGPALATLATLALLGLLIYGLLSKAANSTIDNNLAEGRSTPAPGFELPLLVGGDERVAPPFRLPKLSSGRAPTGLRQRLTGAFADGKLAIRELRGIPVVLNFWASWCVPCREEAPRLEAGWRRDSQRDVLYLGLNMQDITDDAQSFIDEFGITYPTIRDQGDGAARSFGATGIPETYFIDRRSRVVGHVIGVVTPELLAKGARAAHSGRVLGSEQGGARRGQR